MKLVSLGEILWDVIGEKELLGGATFNFSIQLTRLGHDVAFLSAVGDDERGRRALGEAKRLGLDTRYIRTVADAPTGFVSVTVDAAGQPSYVLHRPAAYDFVTFAELPAPDWIYHGTLQLLDPRMHALLARLRETYPRARRFYDINLRRDSYNLPLLLDLMRGASVVKLNDDEVAEMARLAGTTHASLEQFCREWAARHGWQAVCVTRGAHGCSLLMGGQFAEAPGIKVAIADTVGAGDAFAAAFLHGLDAGWPAEKIGAFANRLGALVASRPGGVPDWSMEELTTFSPG